MVEAVDAAAAGAATPHALVVRAPERDHVHRRGVLYIPLNVRPPIPHRHSRRDLVSSSVQRLGEAEPWFELLRGGHIPFSAKIPDISRCGAIETRASRKNHTLYA